jgi:hypothetical protein
MEPIDNRTLSQLQLNPTASGKASLFNLSAIVRQCQRISAKTWLWLAIGGMGFTCAGSLFWLVFRQDGMQLSVAPDQSSFLAKDFSPEVLAGITPKTSEREAVSKLYSIISNYEYILSDVASTHMEQLLRYEAVRLNNEALKEVQESRYNPTDPAIDIDLGKCPDVVNQQRCVLLRFAGDGLKMIQSGTIARDAQTVALGYTRYRAALLALYPQEPTPPDSSMVLQGLLNYRLLAYALLQRLPSADPFAQKLDPKLTQQEGASAIEQANPVPLGGQ